MALDASSLGERFVVLALSVLYGAAPSRWPGWCCPLISAMPGRSGVVGVAQPAASDDPAPLHGARAGRSGALCALALPADRAARLASFPADQSRWQLLSQWPERALAADPLLSCRGSAWSGTGTAFKGAQRRLDCTLLTRWEAGHADPWLILTDLAPALGEAGWYGLRAWIEQSFKLAKRGGWQWQRTRMTDPARAARLWLALAVATLWLLSVGGAADASVPEGTLPGVRPRCARPTAAPGALRPAGERRAARARAHPRGAAGRRAPPNGALAAESRGPPGRCSPRWISSRRGARAPMDSIS